MKFKTLIILCALQSLALSACNQKPVEPAGTKIGVDPELGIYKILQLSETGGEASEAERIAQSVADNLNEYIETVTKGSPVEILDPGSDTLIFGHEQGQAYIITPAGKRTVADDDAAAELGMIYGRRNTQIIGGNIYMKRAASRSTKTEYDSFKKDLLAGKDFETYTRNKTIISAALEQAENSGKPPSNFVRGWQITLDLNSELGVEKSSKSDFYGGAKGFMESVSRLYSKTVSFEDVTFEIEEADLEVIIEEPQLGSDEMKPRVIFTETGFLNPSEHPNGGAGFVQMEGRNYSHFRGPESEVTGLTDDILLGGGIADTLTGGDGRDWLDGNDGADILKGGRGHDVLIGGSGDDDIKGEDGNDLLFSGGGNDKLYGENGEDEFYSNSGVGDIAAYGGPGDDVFYARKSADGLTLHHQFHGDDGSDTISFRNYRASIDLALDGNKQRIELGDLKINIENVENLSGSVFRDTLTGDGRGNRLSGLDGSDTLDGDGGDDIIDGGAGADKMTGGDGNDTLSYVRSSGGVDVSLEIDKTHAFGGDASGDLFSDVFENLIGSSHADVLEGNNLNNIIKSQRGDDYIIATNGADVYEGGHGFDTVDYGNHDAGTGLTLDISKGITGYSYGTEPSVGTHRLTGIEHLVGTKWDDIIKFGTGNNVLEGGKGDDTLYGGAGDDIYFVEAGGGHNKIFEAPGEGRDTVMIGFDKDVSWSDVSLSFIDGVFSVKVKEDIIASARHDLQTGSDTQDLAIEVLNFANSGEIQIAGFASDNADKSPSGDDDFITGRDNVADLLMGLSGNDVLIGGSDKKRTSDKGNLFNGGFGDDQMFGGNGDDIYIFDVGSGIDTITDTGGIDHLYFGPGVREETLLFESKGADIYLGLKPEGAGKKEGFKASEVKDRIRFVDSRRRPTHVIEVYTIENRKIDVRNLTQN